MEKKKVLFINGHLNVGGVEKSLTDILCHLDYGQYEVDLLLLEDSGDYIGEIPKEVEVSLMSLKNTYGSFCSCICKCIRKQDWFSLKMRLIFLAMKLFGQKKIWMAKKLLTGGKHYDIVVGFRPGICTQIAAYAVCADKRIAWWHHGEFNVSGKQYEEQIKKCDALVSVSESCAKMLAEHMPDTAGKIIVISNMIDEELLQQKSGTASPYVSDVTQLVTVGRLSLEKHMENVIYVAGKLKKAGYHFQWHIIGDGAQRDELEILREKEKVTDCVFFEGAKRNPYPYMKYADLYVHPSYVESQGITILEAMALHLPCVVTISRGPSEFIKDGVNGLLTEQNPQALTVGVKHMLEDRKLYEHIQSASVCPERFRTVEVMKKIYELFGQI